MCLDLSPPGQDGHFYLGLVASRPVFPSAQQGLAAEAARPRAASPRKGSGRHLGSAPRGARRTRGAGGGGAALEADEALRGAAAAAGGAPGAAPPPWRRRRLPGLLLLLLGRQRRLAGPRHVPLRARAAKARG